MVALARALLDRGHDAWQGYVGVAGRHDSGCWSGFGALVTADDPRLVRATMDGSVGFAGHVVDAWREAWSRSQPEGPVRVYACGPMVMLRAVRDEAARLGLPCQVSVEQVMGCGLGVCTGCAVENARWDGSNPYERWLLACKSGPVYDADRVVLDGGPHG
jgi:NAD(P)H-flavin reductase